MTQSRALLHAGCVLVGTHGLLIRGASGAGKSYLARLILDHCTARNRYAALVADDQVQLSRHETPQGAYLVAHPAENLAGLMEVRGLGIVTMPYEPAAVVRAVIDLEPAASVGETPARLPQEEDCQTCVLDVSLPRLQATNAHMALDLLVSVLDLIHENRTSLTCGHVINDAFPLAFKPHYGNDTHS